MQMKTINIIMRNVNYDMPSLPADWLSQNYEYLRRNIAGSVVIFVCFHFRLMLILVMWHKSRLSENESNKSGTMILKSKKCMFRIPKSEMLYIYE